MQHITITTEFDITTTGVVRNFKAESLPLKSSKGPITTEAEWILARRQQSNKETLIQIISLRTQPLNLRTSFNDKMWIFEFDIESQDVFKHDDDLLGLLKTDCNNVPMLINLTEQLSPCQFIVSDGPNQNIWFDVYEL